MNKRVWCLLFFLGFKQNIQSISPFSYKSVEKACEQYLCSAPTTPSNLVLLLNYLQKQPRTMHYNTLMKLIETLYAAELIFLHNLGTIIGNNNNTTSLVFSRCCTPTEKKLYYHAETLINKRLSNLKK